MFSLDEEAGNDSHYEFVDETKIRAGLSGVPVRTIQQYEQRQKNINKVQVEYLMMLAQALCCRVEELIEKVV